MAASIVNVQDPVSLNNLAVDASGHIGINNWPGAQTIQGTVNVAYFPAVQAVSGTIDVADRPLRVLGVVTVASGALTTNTAPGYMVIQDGSTNANKLKVNADGSINIDLAAGTALVGSMELVDSGGVNKATISAGGALKVDGSAVIQPTEDIEQVGYVALTAPPTQTNAGAETVLTFSSQVNRVELYNGSQASINYAFDATCTAGSLVLPPGYQLDKPKKVTAVHILTAAATNINGTAAGNIVLLGSL